VEHETTKTVAVLGAAEFSGEFRTAFRTPPSPSSPISLSFETVHTSADQTKHAGEQDESINTPKPSSQLSSSNVAAPPKGNEMLNL
jgi:hypothetical protein